MENNTPPPPPLSGPQALSELLTKEFIFVTGKGGVGKSTSAALLGLLAASRGRRTLVAFPETQTRPHPLFGKQLHEVPTQVASGVDAVIIRPETAMRQYLADVLGSVRLTALLFHSRVARGLLMGIPGPSDWAILGKAWSWSRSSTFKLPSNEKIYDLVILDAPASGDGSDMLRIPQVIMDLAPAARLRKDAESCLLSLQDPEKTAVVLVTLPEEVVIQETEENIALVRNDLRLPLGPLLVNQVRKPLLHPEDRRLLNDAPDPHPTPAAQAERSPTLPLLSETRSLRCFETAQDRAQRETLQIKHLARLAGLGLPTVEIPHLEGSLSGISALQKLQMALAEGL